MTTARRPGFEDNLDFTLGYQVFDADDATGTPGTLTLTVDDDTPVATDDGQAATEGGAAIVTTALTGVLANDAVGADQPGTVTAVSGGTVGAADRDGVRDADAERRRLLHLYAECLGAGGLGGQLHLYGDRCRRRHLDRRS